MGQVRIYVLAKKCTIRRHGWRNVGGSCSLGKWHRCFSSISKYLMIWLEGQRDAQLTFKKDKDK